VAGVAAVRSVGQELCGVLVLEALGVQSPRR
jgi:hypothetical protein